MGMGADSEVLTMSVSRRGRDAGVGGDKCPNSAKSRLLTLSVLLMHMRTDKNMQLFDNQLVTNNTRASLLLRTGASV